MTSQPPPPPAAAEPDRPGPPSTPPAPPVVVREPTVAIVPTQFRPPAQTPGRAGPGSGSGSPGTGYRTGSGYAGSGHPGSGHPGSGYAGSGHPGTGYAGSGHPGTGYSGSGHGPDGHAPGTGSARPAGTTYEPGTRAHDGRYGPPTGYYGTAVPVQYTPPGPAGWPVVGPSPGTATRRRLLPTAALLLGILLVLVAGGGAGAAVAGDGPAGAVRAIGGPAATPAGTVGATARDQALDALLKRRAAAVGSRDKAAFLADVDKADQEFVRRQGAAYDNIAALKLLDVGYKLNRSTAYDDHIGPEIRNRYGTDVRAAAVTITYRVEGIDDQPVAVPWVPVFALVSQQWLLVGEARDKKLPSGVGGQPWDAGPIIVERSNRVVGVFSANSRDARNKAKEVVRLAEQALDRVAKVRSGGWTGKVFVVAVRVRAVFDAYFGAAPERIDQVAAIAVPHYADVHDWNGSAGYVATRIIFNPDELDEPAAQLGDDLTHEFTHAAMAPVTTGWTPTWLVEGFAEYASYKGARIDGAGLKRALRGVATDDLYAGEQFYSQPMNYITGWLACRMISETYGEPKLIALYEGFQSTSDEKAVVKQVLGVERSTLVQQWKEYVARQRS